MTHEELVELEAVAQRAADDFEQRQNNIGDYPVDTPAHEVYARAYGMRLAMARANGTAI